MDWRALRREGEIPPGEADAAIREGGTEPEHVVRTVVEEDVVEMPIAVEGESGERGERERE